jgi:hypothetical protein
VSDAPVRFDHIAVALPRLADAPPVLVGALGGVFESGSPSRGFTWACWRYAGGGRVEVLEPRGADGFLHRFLARQPAGIHHVTFKVASLAEACDRARACGYDIVGYDDSRPGWAEAFLHPRQALGIVVQLAESRPAERLERRPAWTPPAGPAAPPPPVTIVGLRLRARAVERVRVQWADVLGGEAVEGPGSLVYRWPGSPMRVAVDVGPAAPAAADGPVAIEFASDRAVSLPSGPAIGRLFARVPAPS